MYQKSNNYRNGSSKLAVFWSIGSLFLLGLKFMLTTIVMLSKRLRKPINKSV